MPRFYQKNRSGNYGRRKHGHKNYGHKNYGYKNYGCGNQQHNVLDNFGFLSIHEPVESKDFEITNPPIKEYTEDDLYKRHLIARNYISNMIIDNLVILSTENQNFITVTDSMIVEKARIEKEIRKTDKKIQDLHNSLKADYPPNLKQLAQKQLLTTENKRMSQAGILMMFINTTNNTLNGIRSKFPEYDFTLAPEMSKYIAKKLKKKIYAQKKITQRAKHILKKKVIAENKKQKIKKKHDYVVNHVIGFLSEEYKADGLDFEPCMDKMSRECYLNELIEKAHLKHYQKICVHRIDFKEPYDDDYFINPRTVRIDDYYDCDYRKRYATATSVNIIKFENDEGFDLNSTKCSCTDGMRID
jgi:hypothetical protein